MAKLLSVTGEILIGNRVPRSWGSRKDLRSRAWPLVQLAYDAQRRMGAKILRKILDSRESAPVPAEGATELQRNRSLRRDKVERALKGIGESLRPRQQALNLFFAATRGGS